MLIYWRVKFVNFHSCLYVYQRVSWGTYSLLRIKSNTEKAFWARRQTDDLQDRASRGMGPGAKTTGRWREGLDMSIL